MTPDTVFLSVNAQDFEGLSAWYRQLLDRDWDREPMPSCHEWGLTDTVAFQVLNMPEGLRPVAVSLAVSDLNAQIDRLRAAGVDLPDPAKVPGFDDLRISTFNDPEGNPVSLLEGA